MIKIKKMKTREQRKDVMWNKSIITVICKVNTQSNIYLKLMGMNSCKTLVNYNIMQYIMNYNIMTNDNE